MTSTSKRGARILMAGRHHLGRATPLARSGLAQEAVAAEPAVPSQLEMLLPVAGDEVSGDLLLNPDPSKIPQV